jgi:phosphatidyl-myo-inositol dimannoside synthase
MSPAPLKALVITRNLPPLQGGIERLVWHILAELREDFQVHTIGPTGCASLLPENVTASEAPLKPLPIFLVRAAWLAITRVLRVRPNLVFSGSGLTAPIAWLAARFAGATSVVYLYGLDIKVEHPVYRLLWLPFFRHFDRVLVISNYTRSLALESGISPNRIQVLHPGVALPDLARAQDQRNEFRERFKLGDRPMMLYVGRINVRKGLSVFARHILPAIIHATPEARLVVIGDEPRNALRNTPGEWAKVERALTELGLTHIVEFLGPQDDETLSMAYMAADVMVFPVQDIPGDIEGFGMVAIEAAAHNLPTVAFAVGGVPDAVSDGVSGALVAPGDNESFASATIKFLDSRSGLRTDSRQFAESFCWRIFGQRLRSILKATLL